MALRRHESEEYLFLSLFMGDRFLLLTPPEADLFFKLHRALMFFVNQQRNVLPGVDTVDDYFRQPPEARLQVHNAFLDDIKIIGKFRDENPGNFSGDELEVIHSWQALVTGRFFIFRYLKKCTIFLSAEDQPVAYGVLALTDPFEDLIGPYLPVMAETTLFPLKDKIVYDSLLNSFNISFGGGIRRSLKESYEKAKRRLGIVMSLPIVGAKPVAKKPLRRRPGTSVPDDAQDVVVVIQGMVEQFCRDHLNAEYAAMCRKLTEKLARKRPSPFSKGKPTTWACGIIRTIGWVNFLDDRSQSPHMKLTAIDKAFGVGESTGQGKSKTIRAMLKIHQFDHKWTLPSRIDETPAIWMLEVNGFLTDIRNCPREAQEMAFEKGLIPYIPADQD